MNCKEEPVVDDFDLFLAQQRTRVGHTLDLYAARASKRQGILRKQQRREALQDMDLQMALGTIDGRSAMGKRRPTLAQIDHTRED